MTLITTKASEIQPSQRVLHEDVGHLWWASSGCGETCERCGVQRYALDPRGRYTSRIWANAWEYHPLLKRQPKGGRAVRATGQREVPPCQP